MELVSAGTHDIFIHDGKSACCHIQGRLSDVQIFDGE